MKLEFFRARLSDVTSVSVVADSAPWWNAVPVCVEPSERGWFFAKRDGCCGWPIARAIDLSGADSIVGRGSSFDSFGLAYV